MTDAVFAVRTATAGQREIELSTGLDATLQERAAIEAIGWIKSLRHALVDGERLRHRFTFRDDSLWWFAELYLHKQQVIANAFRTLLALDALIEREAPSELELVRGGPLAQGLAPLIAARRGISYRGPEGFGRSAALSLAAMEARATAVNTAALASRLRGRTAPPHGSRPQIAAFVHRAFWRAEKEDGSAEAYIGPVLTALERRLSSGALAYVTVGPASNFRARRWWHALRNDAGPGIASPIEAFAPLARLEASRRLWRERHQMRRALWKSADLRQRSILHGCDCWPMIRDELAGIALLQWPWSARAMDEAGAALDGLQPLAALTYAEAGGWGRALILESRRRQIPTVGLQHGFIYRHWLNYLHEPDEMASDPDRPGDAGFPHPHLTLLFDQYAAKQLSGPGRFPEKSLAVTGSPRLDALAHDVDGLTTADIERARSAAGVTSGALVLVTAKHKEAGDALRVFLDAAQRVPDAHVAIKTHPAETADVYSDVAAGRPRVRVLDASTPLAPLLRASRAVVTVNSTVALDAAVLDIPALVIGLPNNLSPFVDAGIMAGVTGTDVGETARRLEQILYDEEFRRELSLARREFLTRFSIRADGRAAERSADAIVRLVAARQA
jgi:hypothetical protein